MTTALDVITQALRKMQVYSPNTIISNSDAQQGLSSLNDMLDSWSNESLTCYAILEQSGVMLPGISVYTIGPGGDFNMTRPLRLIAAPGSAYLLDSNGDKYLMDVVERLEFNMISEPNINSDTPSVIFYDPQFPLGVINIYPKPDIAYQFFWDSYLQLSEVPSLTTDIDLPPGYKKALQDNLAIELWSYFKPEGSEPTLTLRRDAAISKSNVKRTNIRLDPASYDQAIVAKARGTWDIYSGSYMR